MGLRWHVNILAVTLGWLLQDITSGETGRRIRRIPVSYSSQLQLNQLSQNKFNFKKEQAN